MENNLTKLIEQYKQIVQQKKDYDKNVRKEHFIDDETKIESDLIKEAENMLDRRIEEKDRMDKIEELFHGCEKIMRVIQREFDNMQTWINEEEKRLMNEGNYLTYSLH